MRGARRALGAAALAGAVVFVGLLVVAGNPARSSAEAPVLPATASGELVDVTVEPAQGIAPIDERTAERIAQDVVADLENESQALRSRDRTRATAGADGARLAALWRQIAAPAGRPTSSALPRRARARQPRARRRPGAADVVALAGQ